MNVAMGGIMVTSFTVTPIRNWGTLVDIVHQAKRESLAVTRAIGKNHTEITKSYFSFPRHG